MAWRAEFDTAIPSAPRASALTKSAGVRSPPVMIRVTSRADVGVEVPAGASECGNGGHGDVVAEDEGRRAGSPTPAVEDDVVGTGLEGGFEIGLDVLG